MKSHIVFVKFATGELLVLTLALIEQRNLLLACPLDCLNTRPTATSCTSRAMKGIQVILLRLPSNNSPKMSTETCTMMIRPSPCSVTPRSHARRVSIRPCFSNGIGKRSRYWGSYLAGTYPKDQPHLSTSSPTALHSAERGSNPTVFEWNMFPAPKVKDFEFCGLNVVGVGYILTERLPGCPLCWFLAIAEQRRNFTAHLADIYLELYRRHSILMGSLNYPGSHVIGRLARGYSTEDHDS